MLNAQEIYINNIKKALLRLNAANKYLLCYENTKEVSDLESAFLQLRKVLELLAFASISPNIEKYKELREGGDQNTDFRRDYHAKKIMKSLQKVNKDFYPIPLLKPACFDSKNIHFEKKIRWLFECEKI